MDGDTPKLVTLLSSREGRQAGEVLTGTEDALLPMAAALGHVDMIEHLLDAGRCRGAAGLPCIRCRPHACAACPAKRCVLPPARRRSPAPVPPSIPTYVTGFEVEDCTQYGITGLWMAAFNGPPNALRCIDLLLSKGANINATSREKTTPLAMAAMNGARQHGGQVVTTGVWQTPSSLGSCLLGCGYAFQVPLVCARPAPAWI